MNTRRITLLAGLCGVVLLGAAQVSTSLEAERAIATSIRGNDRELNLGLATTEPILLDGGTAVFTVSESAQQLDLNGDGDLGDTILHVFNAISRRVRNFGLQLPDGGLSGSVILKDRLLAFWAREGLVDLNGDGDTSDSVLHVYDTVRDSLTNLRLGGGSGFLFDGRRLAFAVKEPAQRQDLNADGDRDDSVLHLLDVTTGRIQNTRLQVFGVFPIVVRLEGRWIAVGVDEGGLAIREDGTRPPAVDLNGNGDVTDTVAHVFDTVTGRATNLRLALGPGVFGEPNGFEFGFKVSATDALLAVAEFRQGVDLNGNDEVFDTVLHRVDLVSGRVTNTGIALVSVEGPPNTGFSPPSLSSYSFHEGFAVFNVAEADQGKDLNGDGDRTDVVLQRLSTRSWRMRSLDVTASPFVADPTTGRALLFMPEPANAKDLNDDGDQNDSVLALADLSEGEPRIVNTGRAVTLSSTNGDDIRFPPFDIDALEVRGNRVSFLVPEEGQGNRDLNGDGDTADNVLHVADLLTFTTLNSGLSGGSQYRSAQAPLFPASDGRVLVPVPEFRQGQDLNRDGDVRDIVLQGLDLRTGATRNTALAVAAEPFFNTDPVDGLQVPVLVRGQGFVSALIAENGTDLNSDGDTRDRVLHIIDVSTRRMTNVGLALGVDAPADFFFNVDFLNFIGLDAQAVGFAFSGFAGPLAAASQGQFEAAVGPGTGDAYAFVVSEAEQGNIDLNGDGDTDDSVVHATRLMDRDRNGRFDFAEVKRR